MRVSAALVVIVWCAKLNAFCTSETNNVEDCKTEEGNYESKLSELVRRWAPLVWLAPGERYFPSSVTEFLENMTPSHNGNTTIRSLPVGQHSEETYLVTPKNIDTMLRNASSFLHGRNPQLSSVPVYAVVTECKSSWGKEHHHLLQPDENTLDNTIDDSWGIHYPRFHVTYWMFYPFNQGKTLCTFDTKILGHLPIPKVFQKCLGQYRQYGHHVGDWEHVSMYFAGKDRPTSIYVSVHDAGAYYNYEPSVGSFLFAMDETRKGIIQKPAFPKTISLYGQHPILFSAQGSHGLWTAPGKHRYVKVPRLYDLNGFGYPWHTWKNLQILRSDAKEPEWFVFRGRWGNPKENCHPLSKLGFDICKYVDGPKGLPLKKPHFFC